MILDYLVANATRTIDGVIKDPEGKRDLNVSYSPYALTIENLGELRRMPADIAEEDALRHTLASVGLGWNLQTIATPAEGDATAVLTLSNGATLTAKADAEGAPLLVDVPPTFQGMKAVAVSVLYAVYGAIQADAVAEASPAAPAPIKARAKRTPKKAA